MSDLPRSAMRALLLACCLLARSTAQEVAAQEVDLTTPMTTVSVLPWPPPDGGFELRARVLVPPDAPADLGIGAFVRDPNGRWRQSLHGQPLARGATAIVLRFPAAGAATAPSPGWEVAPGIGLMLWSQHPGDARIRIEGIEVVPLPPPMGEARLLDVSWSGADGNAPLTEVASAWTISARPWPMPATVGQISVRAEIEAPETAPFELPGHPVAGGEAHARWQVCYHPRRPGDHRITLVAAWSDGREVRSTPLILRVAGPPGDIAEGATQLRLQAPLVVSRTIATDDGLPRERTVTAIAIVPADAPSDLCALGFAIDGDGSWRQSARALPLPTGIHRLELIVPAGQRSIDPLLAARPGTAGISFHSARASTATLLLAHLQATSTQRTTERRFADAELAGCTPGLRIESPVGEPWRLVVRPIPASLGDPAALSYRAQGPDGREISVGGRRRDDGRWALQYHPLAIGAHQVRLSTTWGDGGEAHADLRLRVDGIAPVGADARVVDLAAPLVTLVRVPRAIPIGAIISATILVADDAPPETGVGVFVSDRHGRWFQRLTSQPLVPGVNRVRLELTDGLVSGDGHHARWNSAEEATDDRGGLVLWSSRPTRLIVDGPVVTARAPTTTASNRLVDLDLPGYDARSGVSCCAVGERWEMSLLPEPFPRNPYEAEQFTLDAVVVEPDGSERRIAGFHHLPMTASDGGDRELVNPAGAARFAVRFRPRNPGVHRMRLEARWAGGRSLDVDLPTLLAVGTASDPYVRVDAADPRYFSLAGDFYWPNGPNLRSVNDARSKDRMRTRLTPDRGIAAYTAFLARAAAGGANAAEVWMSPWNLALEWRADWPGYYGQGRYNEVNAWKLDRVLDLAWGHGMRINLVIHNHGQASEGADHEWENSSYNVANGGRLRSAAQFFTDEWALAGQERLRRYLVARYADHPAVLGWKLWSEQDLTSGGDALAGWHQHAAKRWRELDSYDHPITSHWCGDFTHAKADVVASLDYVCIDAYHGKDRLIVDLLESSTAGLAAYRKPTLVTEFGGNWDGAPSDAHMAMEHRCGPWAALVTGHAGAPMLWWFEWIDQHEQWSAYGAVARFAAGEDLRGGTKVGLDAGNELWARAISRPGRLLGYLFDRNWARQPAAERARGGERINVGGSIGAGAMTVEWWDPDTGAATGSQRIDHPGGALNLTAPTWRRHLAFKLLRAP